MRATRWIAGLAVLLLVGGVATAVRSRRQAETVTVPAPAAESEAIPEDEAPATEAAIPDDDVHRQARKGHSEKNKWVEEVPGLDISDLNPQQRDVFLSAANSQHCTCGCGYTLAGCRVYDSSCEKSGPRVTALLDSVRAGQIRDATGLRARPPHPG